jgi:hypothetical protein
MIDCVVDYVTTNKNNTKLKEIKLINIDTKTVNEFMQEFDKRFPENEKKTVENKY